MQGVSAFVKGDDGPTPESDYIAGVCPRATRMKPKSTISLTLAGMFLGIATTAAKDNGWFAGHPWVIYLCGSVAIALIATAIIGAIVDKSKKSEEAQSRHENRLENIGNPHVEQHVHVGSDLLRQSAPPQISRSEVKPKIPDIRPRPSDIKTLHELFPMSGDEIEYLVIPFRNESAIGQDRRFAAHIAYKRADGTEIDEVLEGSWFPILLNPLSTRFEAKDTRKLAVLCLIEGKLFTAEIGWRYHHYASLEIWQPDPAGKEITEPIHTIEVTLKNGDLLLPAFVFDFSGGAKPSVKWRDESRA
jgi:hypothetical protein